MSLELPFGTRQHLSPAPAPPRDVLGTKYGDKVSLCLHSVALS
jgi:hypothetical protein